MKRILYSCLLFALAPFFNHSYGQTYTVSVTNSVQCFNPNGNTTQAQVVAPCAGATNYTWFATEPTGTCAPTFTNAVPNGSIVNIGYPCCGFYTIVAVGFNTVASPPVIVCGPNGGAPGATVVPQIICPGSGGTVTVGSPTICEGQNTTLTGSGAVSYTFVAPSGTIGSNNPEVVTPSVTTTYTMYATTAQGCDVATTTVVAVQAASMAISPASQTICLGSLICFTASGTALTGTNVAPSTVTTGISWYLPGDYPGGTPFANTASTCTNAVAGDFIAALTHTGAAGVCTSTIASNVAISTSINVSASASSASVCPGNSVTLTATSIATNYTWTASTGQTLTGNPVVFNPMVATCYTVDADYSNCPGTATVCVGMNTLYPTLSGSSPSICLGTEHTLTATGGNEYTFYYLSNAGPVAISSPSSINSDAAHTPTVFGTSTPTLPATYSVTAFQNGCSGSAIFTVYEYSLMPTLLPSTNSVCPGTNFTLSTGNVGAGATYSFYSIYSPTLFASSPSYSVVHNPGTNIPPAQTYTVRVDSAGCTGSAQTIVHRKIQYPVLTPSTPSICPGTQFTLSSSGGAGTSYTFSANHLISTGPNSSIIPNSPATSNTAVVTPTVTLPRIYTVKVDSAGCIGTGTVEVGQLDLAFGLNFKLNAPTNSVCPNTTFTLTTSTYTGTNLQFFSPSNPTGTLAMQTANSATHTQGQPFPYTYTVIADSVGCTGTATLDVHEFLISPVLSANPNPVCSGMPVNLSVIGVGTGSTSTFGFFQPTGSPTIGIGPIPSVTVSPGPNVATTYTAVVDSANCIGVAFVNVNLNPPLVLNPSSSTPTVCSGVPFTLTVAGPDANYTWYEPTSTGSMVINGPVPYATASLGFSHQTTVTATFTVHAIDSIGCEGTAVVTVSVNPSAQLSLTLSPHNTTICPGQSATLTAEGAVNYTWSPGISLAPNAFTPTVVASPSVTTAYTVTGNNGLGCYGRNTITLTVGAFPVLSIAATAQSVCPGFTSTLTAFGANTYTWTGTTYTGQVAQQSVAVTPGTYTVIGSNGGTCIDSLSTTIGIAPPLNIQLTSSSPTTCIESNQPKFSKPVGLEATGAGSYVWFPYNPIHMTYSLGAKTTVRPPATTQYTVTGYTSICSGTAVITVTVIPQFTMNVTPPLPAICLGDSIKLSIVNVSTLAAGPASQLSYLWAEAGNAPPVSISSYGTPTVKVWPSNTTTYTVEVVDSRGCYSLPRLVTVTVLPRPLTSVAIPTINNVPTNTICFVGLNPGPPDVLLTLVATNDNTNLQFGLVPTYTWLPPKEYGEHNPILTPANNNAITVSAPVRTPAVVVYTVISGYNGVPGCFTEDTVSVRVIDCRPVKAVKFTTAEPRDTVCAGECITFINLTDTMAGGPQKVLWTFRGGDPPVSTYSAPTVCYNLPNDPNRPAYDVILAVENPYPLADGGSSLAIGQLGYITVTDVPNISIIPPGQLKSDTTIRFGTAVSLQGSGGLRYSWSPNYNISSLTDPNVTVKPFRSTQYILTGYNSKRCLSRDTLNVIVIEDCGEMFVPNAFSPNGDGHNDVLKVNGICLQSLTFMIFNRWGEKVFETTDQSHGWDGRYKGVDMNSGVFVYRLEGKTYDGKAYSSKGNITLIR